MPDPVPARDTALAFCRWLVSMDEPEDVLGRAERRTVTLTQIIDRARRVLAEAGSAATDQPGEVRTHSYLSTGCLYGEHAYCQAMTGYQGEKRPGVCKFCDARCMCACHHGFEPVDTTEESSDGR